MREFVDSLNVHCPVCGAEPLIKCAMNSEFPRFESHIERGWLAAMGHLTPRLLWASESGEIPNFVRAIAEVASIADLPNYALLRPVLLELKKRRLQAPDRPVR